MVRILRKPALLNLVLNDPEAWAGYVEKTHGLGDGLPVVAFEDLVPGGRMNLETVAFLEGGSLPTDLALLKALAGRFESCRYFEIGTWRGESVANVADVAARCVTLNLSRADLLERGLGEAYAGQHGVLSRPLEHVLHLEGDSMHFDFAGLKERFDLIFIDGNHHYEHVKHDTEQVFRHLVHDDSIVVWHDYAHSPERIRHEVLAAILDGLVAERHTRLYHASNTLCAVWMKGNFTTRPLVAWDTPGRCFEWFWKPGKRLPEVWLTTHFMNDRLDIRYLDRDAVDAGRWDALIQSSQAVNLYATSWYLDAAADHWESWSPGTIALECPWSGKEIRHSVLYQVCICNSWVFQRRICGSFPRAGVSEKNTQAVPFRNGFLQCIQPC
ncbi:MAG: class I SAM-dependent methyltransferase [Bacteroidales bacterium]